MFFEHHTKRSVKINSVFTDMVLASEALPTLQTRTLGIGKRDLTFDPQTRPEQKKKKKKSA
jgi:hypothetical protein